jgi:Icc-related predicted phosphoesterase
MRLLCASDIHYHLPQLDWLVNRAEQGDIDVVVLPGDHLQVDGRTPLGAQVLVVSKYLARLARSAVVLASSGNHDLDGPGRGGEQHAGWLPAIGAPPLYVDGDSVDLGETRFTICPWWDGPVTRQGVESLLAAAAVDRPTRWVWIYHSPPAGTRLCNSGVRAYPDADLARWIERWSPDVVVCGHIHQAPWVEGGGWVDRLGTTWVFNAGHQTGAEPAHIIIDLEARTAHWFGVPDDELVDLDAPADPGDPTGLA